MGSETISNKVDITEKKDGGVLKEILTEGSGDGRPSSGEKVSVHYVGTLEDGSKFDSSRDRDEQFEFTLGKEEVIKAWDLGVATMKKGEKCRLTCRSDYAYGSSGSPPKIPGDATLIFEVELFNWQGEDLTTKNDGGITRSIIESGEGYDSPNDGAMIEIKIIGKHNDIIFDDREVKYSLGDGAEYNIPEGLEKALEKMKKKEKSRITLLPKYGFGSAGNDSLGVPPNATLEYEVHLQDLEKAKETWEMDQEEKIEQAKLFKIKGTNYYNKEKFRPALKQYKKIIDYLSYDSGLSDEKKAESKSIVLAANLNLSLCHFKLKDYVNSKEYATKAIEIDSNNLKAFYRRAEACLILHEPELAKADLEKCLTIESTNKAVIHALKKCNATIKVEKEKERSLYKGMFDKFAKRDAQKNAANAKGDVMAGDLGEWDKDLKNHKNDSEEDEFSEVSDVIQMI